MNSNQYIYMYIYTNIYIYIYIGIPYWLFLIAFPYIIRIFFGTICRVLLFFTLSLNFNLFIYEEVCDSLYTEHYRVRQSIFNLLCLIHGNHSHLILRPLKYLIHQLHLLMSKLFCSYIITLILHCYLPRCLLSSFPIFTYHHNTAMPSNGYISDQASVRGCY